MTVVNWVTSPGGLGWNKHSRALEGLSRDQSDDGFVMSDHELEQLFDGLRWFGLWKPWMVLIDVFYEIPHSCLEYGTWVISWRETWLSYSTVWWNVVFPYRVGFCIINMRLFLVISWVLLWLICALNGCCFLGIYVVIMLVISMHYDNGYVWLSSCSYL